MEKIVIFNWVINSLIFSLPLSWYLIFSMYKDLNKKNKIIAILENLNSYNVNYIAKLKKPRLTFEEFKILCENDVDRSWWINENMIKQSYVSYLKDDQKSKLPKID